VGGVEAECRICSEPSDLVVFEPCLHAVVCAACSDRVKKCFVCQIPVGKMSSEVTADGCKETGRLKSLEQKMLDLEEQLFCGICMERKRNVAFLCGHGACAVCSKDLVTCHMCRTKIEMKIPLY